MPAPKLKGCIILPPFESHLGPMPLHYPASQHPGEEECVTVLLGVNADLTQHHHETSPERGERYKNEQY